MRKKLSSLTASAFACGLLMQMGYASNSYAASGYLTHSDAPAFIAEMTAEGFSKDYIEGVLSSAKRQESILKAMSRPAEKRLDWGGYSKLFLSKKRVKQGVDFWKQHQQDLVRAEEQFGVPAEIIVAIIGIETSYGRNMGRYRVVDSLATLGFDYPRRAEFFRNQLKEYLILVREEKISDFSAIKGSYAGAMGFGQFMPSSYRNFAVDFNADGKRKLVTDKVDAIGSVANYFKQHGWQSGAPVRIAATLKKVELDALANKKLKPKTTLVQWQAKGVTSNEAVSGHEKASLIRLSTGEKHEYWLGLNNFYVITRYNRSRLYATAVFELSQQIKKQYAGLN